MVFDSTGVKVFGEGEWKVRKHGYSKRRTWRKVHVGMCLDSGQVIVSAITSNNVIDDETMVHMMGAYDTTDCREAIYDLGGRQIIPPDKNAKLQKRKVLPALTERDRIPSKISGRNIDVSIQDDIGRSACYTQKVEPGYRSGDKTGCFESNDRAWDAQKLQSDRVRLSGR